MCGTPFAVRVMLAVRAAGSLGGVLAQAPSNAAMGKAMAMALAKASRCFCISSFHAGHTPHQIELVIGPHAAHIGHAV